MTWIGTTSRSCLLSYSPRERVAGLCHILWPWFLTQTPTFKGGSTLLHQTKHTPNLPQRLKSKAKQILPVLSLNGRFDYRGARIAAAIETAATNLLTTLCCRQTWRPLKWQGGPPSMSSHRSSLQGLCEASRPPKNMSPAPFPNFSKLVLLSQQV